MYTHFIPVVLFQYSVLGFRLGWLSAGGLGHSPGSPAEGEGAGGFFFEKLSTNKSFALFSPSLTTYLTFSGGGYGFMSNLFSLSASFRYH